MFSQLFRQPKRASWCCMLMRSVIMRTCRCGPLCCMATCGQATSLRWRAASGPSWTLPRTMVRMGGCMIPALIAYAALLQVTCQDALQGIMRRSSACHGAPASAATSGRGTTKSYPGRQVCKLITPARHALGRAQQVRWNRKILQYRQACCCRRTGSPCSVPVVSLRQSLQSLWR